MNRPGIDATMPTMKGFISYAHEDGAMFREVYKHLTPIARHYGIAFWTDTKLHTGQHWNDAIAKAISEADVFVALVSFESLFSNYISTEELPAMRTRASANGGLILPVLLNRCLWEYEFSAPQVAPVCDGRLLPISDWPKPQDGYHAASVQIADAIKLMKFSVS